VSGAPSFSSSTRRGHAQGTDEQWRRAGPWLARQLGRDGSHRKAAVAVGVGHDRGCAAPARACVRGAQRDETRREKGRDDGGWPRRGPHGGERRRWTRTRLDARPGSAGPTPLLSCSTCCAVVCRSSPTASWEDARILCGGELQRLASCYGSPVWSDGSALCFFHSSKQSHQLML
jgi:hypothetical protein